MSPQEEAFQLYQQGCSVHHKGNPQLAYDFFLRAVELDPGNAPYRLALALNAEMLSRPARQLHDLAYFHACEACRLDPTSLGNLLGMAQIARETHHYREAIRGYEHCLRLAPENGLLWYNLAFTHMQLDHGDKALECALKAVELDPEIGDAHMLLTTLFTNDRHDNARIAYHGEKAFTAKNKAILSLEAMWNAAHGFLGIGCYEKGWGYFEARLHRNVTNKGRVLASHKYPQPMWKGERDCTVLITQEMGLGDLCCMARFFPIIERDFGVTVKFEGPGSMLDLLRYNFPSVECAPTANGMEFDYHLPIMSLPFICKTRADSVPWDGPYIRAEPAKIDEWWWSKGSWADKSIPNIGLCWSTGANLYNAANFDVHKKKSVPFELLKPLLDVPGIRFVSLQTDNGSELMPNPGIKSFSDTAAILHHLDGVITVDTALANLAGAMGAKTWLMDRADNDWRWLPIKTPWFPTVRVFKQKKLGEWEPVIAAIREEIALLAGEKGARATKHSSITDNTNKSIASGTVAN